MQELLPFALLGFALLVFGWVMFRLMIRNRTRKKRNRSPQQQVADVREESRKLDSRGDGALRDAPKEVLRWQVEMTETARDLKAELDSKISLLNATVRLADSRIAEMKSLLEKVESQTTGNQTISDAKTDNQSS